MSPTSLTDLAADLLRQARTASSGRGSHALTGGRGHRLHQILVAITAGHGLTEHNNPGEATLQILEGRAELATASATWTAAAGDHLVIPDEPHSLNAIEDTVALLTVFHA